MLRPVPVLCSKIAFLRATLPALQQAVPVLNTNAEAEVYLRGGNPFYHFTDWIARPSAILFGLSPCQKLTDVLIIDRRAVVFSAELLHFVHPGEQRFGIDLALFPVPGRRLI